VVVTTGMLIAAFTGLCERWVPGCPSIPDYRGRITMRSSVRLATPFAGVVALTLVAAGCWRSGEVEDAAAQTAKKTLEGTGTERTVESQQHVIVQDTKKVIDANTGQVIKAEETKTPVTITVQRTTERKVEVNSGETKKTVK
jgi:hypothetical protein